MNLLNFFSAILKWGQPQAKRSEPAAKFNMSVPQQAVDLIKDFEGFQSQAYKDIVGIWTVGYGFTGEDVKEGVRITPDQADQMLKDRLKYYARSVQQACTLTPSPFQLGAMTSLAYNVGVGNFQKSTLLKRHNSGQHEAAADQFLVWNKARISGVLQEVAGLTRRRVAERAMYIEGTSPNLHNV